MAAKKQYKLNLWNLLSTINMKNIDYYDNLTEEEIKEFSPLVIMRWLTGCSDSRSQPARQLCFINEFLNMYVFELSKHKKLLFYLMILTTYNFDGRYKFIKKHNSNSKFPKSTKAIKELFNYNKKDAQEAVAILSATDIISMAKSLGYQDPEIKEIKKELKNKSM